MVATNAQKHAFTIAVLAGDGVGPEVTAEAVKVLKVVADATGVSFQFKDYPVGGVALAEHDHPFPAVTADGVREADAVLFGAVGDPRWDHEPGARRPESAVLNLRKQLNAFANLRPLRLPSAAPVAGPLRSELIGEGLDILIVRELTGGIYFGERGRYDTDDGVEAFDRLAYHEKEIERLVRVGFEAATLRRGRLHSVDKANVLETSRLWRSVVERIAPEYETVTFEHMYVDNAAMQLVLNPRRFDVIVTENMFGDILSDLGAAVVGSIGLLPSASLGDGSAAAIYEPIHGSAPDIAGQGICNPIAAIASAGMMLRYSFGMPAAADAVERAVDQVICEGPWTPDLAPDGAKAAATSDVGDAVADVVRRLLT